MGLFGGHVVTDERCAVRNLPVLPFIFYNILIAKVTEITRESCSSTHGASLIPQDAFHFAAN